MRPLNEDRLRECSVACCDLDLLVALLALYEAAPVELASAPLHPRLSPPGVAAVAAHHLATVETLAPLKQKHVLPISNE